MRPRLERLSREFQELIVLGVAEDNRLRHVDHVEWEHQVIVRPSMLVNTQLRISAFTPRFRRR